MSLISKIFYLSVIIKMIQKIFRQKIALWDLLIPLSKIDKIYLKKLESSFIIINN